MISASAELRMSHVEVHDISADNLNPQDEIQCPCHFMYLIMESKVVRADFTVLRNTLSLSSTVQSSCSVFVGLLSLGAMG